jgi:hypothetical protein
LIDILVEPGIPHNEEGETTSAGGKFLYPDVSVLSFLKKKKSHYLFILPKYKSQADLAEGLKKGIYYQGPLFMNRSNVHEGYLHSEALEEDILLQGRESLNRYRQKITPKL